MHPAFLDDMSWEMAEVYGAISDQILINLARYFPFYDAGDEIPKTSFEYQAKMLAQMGQINAETIRIIRNGLKDADEALKKTLEQAIIDAVQTAEPELVEAVKKGVFAPPTMPIVSPNQTQAFKRFYEQAANKLNLVNTVMLESTQSAFSQTVTDVVSQMSLLERMNRIQIAIDTAAGETITGVSSWNQALRHATERLKENGITGFIDHAGHHWSAEAYVAMDIRTTTMNTGRAAVWETNQSFGNDLYSVSFHSGARPLCYPWQLKVISSTDNSRTVYDLEGNSVHVYAQSETSYGQPAGLFGINCHHFPSPFIPGVSVAGGNVEDIESPEENARLYAESQKQREMERKIREEKRDLQIMQEQGAPEEDVKRQREKIRETSSEIDEFCKETGRARHRDREAVYTKREFPDADKYDVSAFERKQKELIDNYYEDGGAQTYYPITRIFPNYENVTKEYKDSSEPGIGVVAREHGKKQNAKQHEIDVANELIKSVGGSVSLIDNAGQESKRDLIWHDKTWEVKRASSVNAAYQRTRTGMAQIKKTGGNLIIDLWDDDYEASFDSMLNGLKRYAPNESIDIVVMGKGSFKTIIRYKKK